MRNNKCVECKALNGTLQFFSLIQRTYTHKVKDSISLIYRVHRKVTLSCKFANGENYSCASVVADNKHNIFDMMHAIAELLVVLICSYRSYVKNYDR